jgi:rRNA maturation endonuclease Nob1
MESKKCKGCKRIFISQGNSDYCNKCVWMFKELNKVKIIHKIK